MSKIYTYFDVKNVKLLMFSTWIFMNFRCLPMNFRAEDLASGILRERVKVGASLADVDPMNIDKSVSFVNSFPEDFLKKMLLLVSKSTHNKNKNPDIIIISVLMHMI